MTSRTKEQIHVINILTKFHVFYNSGWRKHLPNPIFRDKHIQLFMFSPYFCEYLIFHNCCRTIHPLDMDCVSLQHTSWIFINVISKSWGNSYIQVWVGDWFKHAKIGVKFVKLRIATPKKIWIGYEMSISFEEIARLRMRDPILGVKRMWEEAWNGKMYEDWVTSWSTFQPRKVDYPLFPFPSFIFLLSFHERTFLLLFNWFHVQHVLVLKERGSEWQ